MAAVTIAGRRDRGGVVARPITDRALLRDFLDHDRLFAAYAICDLEDREWARTRWGAAFAGDDLIAVALEYAGPTPQPLFVMGRNDGITAILRDLIRPRAAYVASLREALPGVTAHYRVDPGPPMVRMWVDRERFRPVPVGREVSRLVPAEIGELNRLYQLGFASWLPSQSVADGVYFGLRLGGRLIAAAGTHVVSPDRTAGRRRQRPHPLGLPGPRLCDRCDQRRDDGADANLRRGRAQRPIRQSASPPGVPEARLRRARALRGAPRPPSRIPVGGAGRSVPPDLLVPQGVLTRYDLARHDRCRRARP